MKASLLPLAIFGTLVIFLFSGLSLDPSKVPSPLIGSRIPAFSAERLSVPGLAVSHKDLSDSPMLVNVWGTWCQGCLAEHPLLMDIAARYGVSIYGLNYRDERGLALDWLENHGDPYRLIIYDPDGKVALEWGVYGAPETFVIDKQGVIRYKHIGILSREILERKILPLITNDFITDT